MGSAPDEEDPHTPIRYECTVLGISLNVLQSLSDWRVTPGSREFERVALKAESEYPIMVLNRIRSGSQLGAVSLDEISGVSYVFVVKRPDRIVFEDLDEANRITLKCPAPSEGVRCISSCSNFDAVLT